MHSPFLNCIRRKGFSFALLILSVAAGFACLPKLLAYPDPTGLNGYFYLKQTKTIAASGTFYFSDHSLAFLPLVLLRWILPTDLLAFQWAIPCALTFLYLGIAQIIAGIDRSRPGWAIGYFLATIAALFSSSFFPEFSLGFFKNLVAAGFVVWSMAALAEGKRIRGALFFALAFLTHKSVALLAGIYLFRIFAEAMLPYLRRRDFRKALWLLLSALAAAMILGLLFLYHFPKAQAFLGFAFHNFSGPSDRIGWLQRLTIARMDRVLELVAFGLIGILLLFARGHASKCQRAIIDMMLAFAFIALQPFQPSGAATLGYRLILLLPALLYPLASMAILFPKNWQRSLGLLPLLVAAILNFSPLGFSDRAVKKQIRSYSAIEKGVRQIPTIVNQSDHLSSHHGLEFYVDYLIDIRSRSFLAPADFKGPKYRIVFFPRSLLPAGLARDDLEQIILLHLGRGYALVHEEDWQDLESQYDLPSSWKNSIGERPAHVYE